MSTRHTKRASELIRHRGRRYPVATVEAGALRADDIAECAVVQCRTAGGATRAVAFVRTTSGRAVTAEDLPGVPVDEVVTLSSLPLDRHGRVDYALLRQAAVLDRETLSEAESAWRTSHGLRESAVLHREVYDYGSPVAPLAPPAPAADEDTAPAAGPRPAVPAYIQGPPILEVPGDAQTVTATLYRAARAGEDTGCHFVDAAGRTVSVPYARLLARAERVAAHLQRDGVTTGDRVLLLAGSQEEFTVALWGTLLCGATAVPVTPSADYRERRTEAEALRRIWTTARRPRVLTTPGLLPEAARLLDGATLLSLADAEAHDGTPRPVDIAPDLPALILFTSGSTGTPKGVVQSHATLLNKQRAAVQHSGYAADDVFLNWLAIEHVVGLVHAHLLPVYLGARQVHAATDYVLHEPLRWAELASTHRATNTWGPNSMLALLADAVADAAPARWDLSAVRRWINAGEQVHYATCQRLLTLLEPYGLPADAVKPEWGMSETCNMVIVSDELARGRTTGVRDVRRIHPDGTLDFADRPGGSGGRFVECGRVYPGVEARVVDEEGTVVPEGRIGTFQVRGATRLLEYFNNPEANARFFREDGWFDTGDLAFIQDRRVTFTGRGADRIIVNGLNYQNVDLEALVETVPGVLPTFAAACSVRAEDDVTDHLAVFYVPETTDPAGAPRHIREIQAALRREFGMSARYVVPLRTEQIPKTSIGKIQRGKLVARLTAGEYDEILRSTGQLRGTRRTQVPPWFFTETTHPRVLPPAAAGRPVALTLDGGAPADREQVGRALAGALTVVTGPVEEHSERPLDARVDLTLTRDGWGADDVLALLESTTGRLTADGGEAAGPRRILLVSVAARGRDDTARAYLGALQGYVRSVNDDTGAPTVVWCDLDTLDAATATALAAELTSSAGSPVVAHHGGVRTERVLAPAPVAPAPAPDAGGGTALRTGGSYLISGGLGGVGREVSRFLADRYGARLILVGSTPEERLDEDRRRALAALAARTRVRYVTVDLAAPDAPARLRAAVGPDAGRLDGAFHLAGLGTFGQESLDGLGERGAVDGEQLARYTALKVGGLFALAEAAGPAAPLVAFSSVNAYFGGAGYAEYSASNSALNEAVRVLRARGHRAAVSLGWSAWAGLGMSRGSALPIERRGFVPLEPDPALESLLLALGHDRPVTYVGLDGAHPGIAAQVRHKPGWRLVPAYYYAAGTELPADGIAALAPGTEIAQVPQLPRRRDGQVDTVRLLQSAGTRATGARPETETERRLAAVWERILGTEDLARDDDFFSLGGHSLMAARLGNDIRAEFGVTLALHEVFGDPTLAAIAAVIDAKSAHPADTPAAPDTSAAPGAEPEDGLSAAQRRIFFAESVEPGLALYNIVAAWELTGALDAELLEKALHHVVRRHEALRTVFDTVEGSPVARVVDRPEVPLRRVALDTLDEEEAQARLARTLDAELRHVYDLAAAPLARCTLAALPGDRAVLIVSHHHLASDGWSLGVFMRDLVLVYNALADRDLPELPALPADVPALVRRQDAAGAASEQAAEHWRRQLSRDIAPLELPLDHPRPQMQSYAGDTLFLELGPEEVRRISTAAAGAGVSTAVWLASAYGVLLARLTGRQEFFVGMPAMRRDDPALADAVGMLVNTLPHLMTVPADRPVDAQCAAVRQGMTDLLRYQDYPFDHMVARFGPERDTSRPPLVQTMFNYVPMEGFPQFTGTTRAPLELRHPIARFDFSLHAYERENGLVLAFEYATALFRAETVRGWQQAFRTLIEAMAAGPRTPVGELAVVPAGERERALTLGRNTRAVPEQGSVAAAFAATARAHPDRTALEHGADTLTYRELDDRSAALAAHLAGHGVAAGDRVALDAAKRIDTITGMLAVLRLGASYVPVDPEQPAPVTAAVLRAGGIRGHLTTGGWTGIDADGERTGAVREIPSGPAAAAPPHREISGADEAYVMFTSGTTGRPKGVAIANSSVVGLVRDPDWISFGTGTRVLQTGSLSFDAATLEVWAPLLNGGTLVLTDKENILDVTRLRAEIERSQPTLMWVSAPLFHQLTDADPALFTGVADLLVGGDVVSPEHVNRVLERSPGTRITNGYGPTENTTFTTTHTMTAPVDGPVPIGRPIRGRTALVADESGQVVPFGVQGELYVGGEGLALGYVGNTEETARRFTELPALPGERLYRTGDFATQDADGVIHYRGRKDGQVKVRGHRVELDAVRTALCSLPGVRDAFVLSLPDAGGALAAHVAADGTDAAELRTRVRTLLPPYAVPSAIQVYDALPLKSSGKVDVALLRTGTATAPAEPAAATGTAEPLPPHAERLLAAYAAVLNVPHVGPDDSFFDLGGDSLLTIKLVSVLREEGVPVDPKQVFLYPDVRTLAAALEDHEQQLTARGGRPAAKLVRLRPEPGDGPDLVLAPPAGGTVLGYIELARHLRGFGRIHGVEAPGLGAGESLVLPSFEEAVDFCYEAAQDVLGNSGYVGGHSLGGHIAFHLASALIDKGVKPKGLIILDTPPNLGDIPVADADLTEEETRVFILAMGIGGMLDQDRDRLRQLPYEEAKRVLLERARKDPRVSAFLSAEYLDRFLRLQMHQLMYSREVALPDRALDIPVFVFRTGEHGTDVARLFSDWSRYTTREVTFVDIPGDHASMLRAPHVTEVARLLDQHCGAPR
ncbi:non-ribosomal peptide synthetase [Streptomyces harbinensis]|uniref:Amino acid adenylation domain-containing protein n=1 Tax=Streptomyces harbinensis TaxID=1176198 RepID=A0A1I6PBC9_9ACTN|nr:non-ribosomal peptide synthetase [Streptomyces harbinensis]SFS37445.1 amino acid adenylation domain-containing protein [Streptomyces harbinensis]